MFNTVKCLRFDENIHRNVWLVLRDVLSLHRKQTDKFFIVKV